MGVLAVAAAVGAVSLTLPPEPLPVWSIPTPVSTPAVGGVLFPSPESVRWPLVASPLLPSSPPPSRR